MYETILVPTDGSEAATQAAEEGLKLAEQFGSTVHLLSIVEADGAASPDPTEGIGMETLTDETISALVEEASEVIEQLESQATKLGIDTVTKVQRGVVGGDILDYAHDQEIELIVMGTHGRDGFERFLLGSVTEDVIRTADMPILVVRSDE